MQTPDSERAFKILYVDDEEKALKYFKMGFGDKFSIITASDVAEALRILEQQGDEIAVLITDQRMPERNGVDLLCIVRELHPAIVRILTTAYADLSDAIAAVNSGEILRYITKPWNMDALVGELNLAMRFFLLQRQRDLLMAEKLSVGKRLMTIDRLRHLVTLAAALGRYVNHSLSAVEGFLSDFTAMDSLPPLAAESAGSAAVDLGDLPQWETQRIVGFTESVSHSLASVQWPATDYKHSAAEVLWPQLDTLEDRARQLCQDKHCQIEFAPCRSLADFPVNKPIVQQILAILRFQALNRCAVGSVLKIVMQSPVAVGPAEGMRLCFSAEVGQWDVQESFLFGPSGVAGAAGAAGKSGEISAGRLTGQAELLAAYFLSYHHGGQLTIKRQGSQLNIVWLLPFDPRNSLPQKQDPQWLQQLLLQFEGWD